MAAHSSGLGGFRIFLLVGASVGLEEEGFGELTLGDDESVIGSSAP